jgi:hypothetical protein
MLLIRLTLSGGTFGTVSFPESFLREEEGAKEGRKGGCNAYVSLSGRREAPYLDHR